MTRLVFLGRLQEAAGGPMLEVAAGQLADVIAALPSALQQALADPRVKLALNGELTSARDFALGDDDELAFLPPVSGG
jgi:molybdopterin synthase sulfur carrier subunit